MPQASPEPTSDIFDVGEADLAALDRLKNLDHTRSIGLFVIAALALRGAQWAGAGHLRVPAVLPFALAAAGIVLIVYALWSEAHPEGVGQALLRVHPDGEIVAGGELAVTLLLRPRKRLDLDPLKVRLFAQGADVGLIKGAILHESVRLVGERRTIEGGRAARFEARILLPDDVPTSKPGKPVRWRIEVSAGEPAVFSAGRSIRVRSSA